jgi:ATP-dependent 26S proteasome regulatory subunit
VENYDKAFETRVRHIYFPLPDELTRRAIWQRHLPAQLPLGKDVSMDGLAVEDDLCGRDIKNAVIDAALRAARSDQEAVTQNDFVRAIRRLKAARINSDGRKLNAAEKADLAGQVQAAVTKDQRTTSDSKE